MQNFTKDEAPTSQSPAAFEWHHLQALLTRPIAFHPIFAKISGGAVQGIFLSQAYYWTCVVDATEPTREGWFYKTGREWHSETLLTRREQESARRALRKLNLIEEKNAGIPSRKYYRLNKEALLNALDKYLPDGVARTVQTSLSKTSKQEGSKRANKSEQIAQTLNEAKTTALNTTFSATQIETRIANLSEEQGNDFDDKVRKFITTPAGKAMNESHSREEIEIFVMRDLIEGTTQNGSI